MPGTLGGALELGRLWMWIPRCGGKP